ncbi:hypothetical protein QWM81_11400 [Streptomyces ficellus]|uniref:Uncharacterized protein n=1 Tax=Streptomyces ficellus TaxID=1977088 RepID=A0ABT7Z564_9ACTN|nr:hypothetical protein [Streptomyces ficellus]MDN3294650.1 hypothetical protein [Streptomyces ficellus]
MNDQTSDPAQPGAQSVVCSRCGKAADSLPVTWTCSVEAGTRHYFCDDCARENLRAIESRLDSAWW